MRIESHIESKLAKHNLQDLLLISVKDNGSNVKACAKNMAAKLGFKGGNADDFECFAHNIHLLLMKDVSKNPLHADLLAAILKAKKTHRALAEAFKTSELKQMSLEDQSLNLQDYLLKLEGDIGKLSFKSYLMQQMRPTVAFKNSNETRWDSTQVLLETRRLNEAIINRILPTMKIRDVGRLYNLIFATYLKIKAE